MAEFNNLTLMLGRNIYSLRSRKRLTQDELAKLANIPRATLSRIESCDSNPSLLTLSAIADALNTSLDQLITPKKYIVEIYRSFDAFQASHSGRVRTSNLLPDQLRHYELRLVEIDAESSVSRKSRGSNHYEFVTVLEGKIGLTADGVMNYLKAGQSAYYRCDQPITYQNDYGKTAKFIALVLPLALV